MARRVGRRLLARVGALVTAVALGGPALAQSIDAVIGDLMSGRFERLVAEAPEAAVDEIAAALPTVLTDPRLAFDLVALRAEAEGRAGDGAASAASLRDLAGLAIRHRDVLDRDPRPYLQEAAAAFEALGDYETALRLARAVIAEMQDAGLPEAEIATAQDEVARLADLAGRDAEAAAARRAAAALRAAPAPLPDGLDGAGPPGSTLPPGVVVPGRVREVPPQEGLATTRSAEDGYEVVEVFYATDRARTGDPRPTRFYGAGRGDLELGTLEVTIPRTHRAGALEAPSVWRLEFGPNPARHVVLRSVTPRETDAFFARMRGRLSETGRTEAVVFVHGYNVTFEHAAKRAAQLAYDTSFPGLPILYSWPSRGATAGYMADTAVVRLSGRRLAGFLEDLVARSGATVIHLVAHSMGNRAMTDALEILALRRGAADAAPGGASAQVPGSPPFDQIVFAAPDLDAGLFAAMMPTIRPLARRITLYGSEADWALVASRKLHGDAPRAGQGGADALALAQVDTIDMSALGEDMLAHSYISNDSSVLLDLVSLFWKNADPPERCGVEAGRVAGGITVWRYTGGRCRDNVLIGLLATLLHDDAQSPAEVSAAIAAKFGETILPEDVIRVVERMAAN